MNAWLGLRYARRVDALMEIAKQKLAELELSHPLTRPVTLEKRFYRTTAGRAHFRDNAITLSFLVCNTPEKVVSTLVHEYAHLLAYFRYGAAGKSHGPGWRNVMRELGQEPIVKHDFECTRNKVRQQVIYGCRRCQVEIVRNRRLPKGRKYTHAGCGGAIELKRVERKTV